MPIIKSAKKRMRQNEKRRKRNYITRSLLKTHFKKVLELVKEGKKDEAKKAINVAYSVLDTAVKKNVMHKNTAARRKSRLAKELNDLESGKTKAKAPTKKTAKKAAKKTEEEKAEVKGEEKAAE